MNVALTISLIMGYFVVLLVISYITSRKSDNDSFFSGNKKSTWYIVAFGMIGTSLSGVTFMSVPGWVSGTQFSYLMIVVGYLIGYGIISFVLLPMYYKLNLTSIYTYLQMRMGERAYKTGASFFLISRTLGASLRMFLVVNVLQIFVFDALHIPFFVSVFIFLLFVILYTYQGGVKTIVWTDMLQTACMLAALVITIVIVNQKMQLSLWDSISKVADSQYSQIIFTDWTDKKHFLKQILSGTFIAVVMTGLDQEMMQKNLSCRTLKEAQKNVMTFSVIMLIVNILFLYLGALLYQYSDMFQIGIPAKSDDLFPSIALHSLGAVASIIFLLGLISAAFPSADGALTSLTTSFCIDILGNKKDDEKKKLRTRYVVHLSFALLLMLCIVLFREINDSAVISKLFTIAGYTYGPLLGMYSFGMFTHKKPDDKWIPYIAISSPVICFLLDHYSTFLFAGYKFGFELLIINGLITFSGLWLISKKRSF